MDDDEPWYMDDDEQGDGEEDCLGCGLCEWCIQRSIDAAEDDPPRIRWRRCEVCGRGLSDEDEDRQTGMCLPCAME